jgi:hypothetical protein
LKETETISFSNFIRFTLKPLPVTSIAADLREKKNVTRAINVTETTHPKQNCIQGSALQKEFRF